jgi:predicted nucleic-acid-binding protein
MKPWARPWRRSLAAIDTNVFIRLLTQDDPVLTAKAEAHLSAHAPLWISVSVLVETYHVLTKLYGWKKPAMVALLQSITSSRSFVFQDQSAVVAATHQWVTAKAGFVDCLNVALAGAHGKGPLATFDRSAAGLAGATKA